MSKKKFGINGFGRIGRTVAKINAQKEWFDLVAVNDIDPYIDNMAYLFKYDSTYGRFPGEVKHDNHALIINGHPAVFSSCAGIKDVDWGDCDFVVDSSGVESNVTAAKDLASRGRIQRVVVTHSSGHVDHEVIMGVNDDQLTEAHRVVSCSICDANAVAHVLKWIDDEYGIDRGAVTTHHPWLSYQNLVDGPMMSQSNPNIIWKDYALGRASASSVIPKNTTTMEATEKAVPGLKGKIMSFSYRVPTDIVASSDLTLCLNRVPTCDEMRDFLDRKASESAYVRANYESLVSQDYEKEEVSAVIDMQWLKIENGMVKVILWYDNEWGYAARVLDLARKLYAVYDMNKVIALDFDGVICDSLWETCLVSYNAYRRVRDNRLDSDEVLEVPEVLKRQFRVGRGFVGPAPQFFLLWTWLERHAVHTLNQERLLSLAEKRQDEMERFGQVFFGFREELKKRDFDVWCGLNPVFPHVKEDWPLVQAFPLYLITTKDFGSTEALLRFHGLDGVKKIFAKEQTIDKKESAFRILETEQCEGADMLYVDDHPSHLRNVASSGARVYWAAWGYGEVNQYPAITRLRELPEITENT